MFAWNLADIGVGLYTWVNLVALVFLAPVADGDTSGAADAGDDASAAARTVVMRARSRTMNLTVEAPVLQPSELRYSTVTVLARFRGWSTLMQPLRAVS